MQPCRQAPRWLRSSFEFCRCAGDRVLRAQRPSCFLFPYIPPPPNANNNTNNNSGDDQARDFRGKIPADVIGEAKELPAGVEADEELSEIIRRTLAGGMDLAQDACAAADEVGVCLKFEGSVGRVVGFFCPEA